MIVFDIDGTLADCTHRLGYIDGRDGTPKDWHSFHLACTMDRPIEAGVLACRAIRGRQSVEFWTGRPETVRPETRDWLAKYVGQWASECPLKMRAEGDHRKDFEVKVSFALQSKVQPLIVFEDRTRVVTALREVGITVYQVAGGNY